MGWPHSSCLYYLYAKGEQSGDRSTHNISQTRRIQGVGYALVSTLVDIFFMLLQPDQFCFGFVEFEAQQSMVAAIEVCLPSCLVDLFQRMLCS